METPITQINLDLLQLIWLWFPMFKKKYNPSTMEFLHVFHWNMLENIDNPGFVVDYCLCYQWEFHYRELYGPN